MNVMTKRGSLDNVITYEHWCDTAADMNNIDPSQITLGSVCVVVEGELGVELYIANSKKKWIPFTQAASSDSDEQDEG